jgi:hypothetical protein
MQGASQKAINAQATVSKFPFLRDFRVSVTHLGCREEVIGQDRRPCREYKRILRATATQQTAPHQKRMLFLPQSTHRLFKRASI